MRFVRLVAGRPPKEGNPGMEPRARLVGFNHVAVEVDDVDEALEFYGRIFDFELRGRGPKMAFIDAGDQFIAVAGRGRSSLTGTATSASSWTTGRPSGAR